MYKITAENMTAFKCAAVVAAANETAFNIIYWDSDVSFVGPYYFIVDADVQTVYDIQTAIYQQNDSDSCKVEPFEWKVE
jgi:hypothetical protein